MLRGVAVSLGALLLAASVALPSAPAARAAGVGEYGPAVWLPVRTSTSGGELTVGCTYRSPYEPQRICDDFNGDPAYHPYWALDLAVGQAGAAIFAAGAGQVAVNSVHSSYGTHVVVDHGGHGRTLYAHLAGLSVVNGQWVDQNTQLGTVGNSGSTGGTYHLHYEYNDTSGGWGRTGTPNDPGQLRACHGDQLVLYPDAQHGGQTTWEGLQWGALKVHSDGTACGRQEPPAADADADGVTDEADVCPAEPGVPGDGGCTPQTGEAVDANGDGKTDLVHRWSQGVNTWLSRGDGGYDIGTHQAHDGYGYTDGFWIWSACCASGSPLSDPAPGPDPGPSEQPTGPASITRLAGGDRLGTAIAISKNAWGDQAAQSVVLARHDAFPDALAGTPLAVVKNAPLLLTPSSALNAGIAAEIKRVLPGGRTVYLLGGTGALSPGVADAVTRLGYKVARLGGADRYATAVTISKQLGTPSRIFEATGLSFQNALISGVAAARTGGVVVLTADAQMPAATRGYLDRHPGVERVAVGPQAGTADPSATKVSGPTVYDTARLLAERYFPTPRTAALASGTVFADALAGGAHIGRLGGPLLISEPTRLPVPIADYLSSNQASIDTATLYGGTVALSTAVEDSVRANLRQ